MPELPEVETVCRGLRPAVEGHRLCAVRMLRGDLRRPLPVDFVRRLTGRTVTAIGRRAKYMTWSLDDGWTLLVHLGMSGRMLVSIADQTPPGPHDHVLIDTEQGRRIVFHDPRRFGLMDLVETARLADHPLLRGLGPEPLAPAFTGRVLAAALAGRRIAVKQALLDQKVVAGIGNIYASEALFRARLSPLRGAGTMTAAEAKRLVDAIKGVLEQAIAAGGSSLRDHRQPSGELGYFQHAFAVYDRAGQPCPACGRAEIERIVQGGRSTYWCPKCQH